MSDILINGKHWFHTWWGVILLGAGSLFAIGALIFAGLVGYYWWQIHIGGRIGGSEKESGFTLAIKDSPRSNKAFSRTELETASAPALGKAEAPVVIVEFFDFKCPFCRASAPIMQKVADRYGDRVKLIFRNFPVESLHPGTTALAELAYCAHRQNRFWLMHDVLYAEQNSLPEQLGDKDLVALAERTNMDRPELEACLKSPAPSQEARRDYLAGLSAGVRGTPTFFINGKQVEGVIPFEAWERYLKTVK